MLSSHSLPETQAALALSIFVATFICEDGATLLAATLSANGSLDPRIGLLTTFFGIWLGDMGLYGLGSSFGRRAAQSRWLRKFLSPELLARAESWFAMRGSMALIMSRAIPGSRLPLYVAAGALRFPVRLFAKTTAACSAVWVSTIFAIWRFIPKTSSGHQRVLPWLLNVRSSTRMISGCTSSARHLRPVAYGRGSICGRYSSGSDTQTWNRRCGI